MADITDELMINEKDVVKFEITDVDDDYCYTYKEYINDKLVKEGKQWYKDIKTKQEKKAWKKAVVKYKKDNGIKMLTDKIVDKINDVKEIINKLDDGLPVEFGIDIPHPTFALPKLSSDPCEFISQVAQTATAAVDIINGLPNVQEVKEFYKVQAINNVTAAKNYAQNSVVSIIKPAVNAVLLPIEEGAKTLAQEIAAMEEMEKKRASLNYAVSIAFNDSDVVPFEPSQPADYSQYDGIDYKIYYKTKNEWGAYQSKHRLTAIAARRLGISKFNSEGMQQVQNEIVSIPKNLVPAREQKNATARIHSALKQELIDIFADIKRAGYNQIFVSNSFRSITNNNGAKNSRHKFGAAVDICGGSGGNPDIRRNGQGVYGSSQWQPAYRSQQFTYTTIPTNIKCQQLLVPGSAGTSKYYGYYDKNKCIWTPDHPVVSIFLKHGWYWGGIYGDYMHFSIDGR